MWYYLWYNILVSYIRVQNKRAVMITVILHSIYSKV